MRQEINQELQADEEKVKLLNRTSLKGVIGVLMHPAP
jgi:hypothetical protein